MRAVILLAILLAFVTISCSAENEPPSLMATDVIPKAQPTYTAEPVDTVSPAAPEPSNTPQPTNTPLPTETPTIEPTPTVEPTQTPTPTPVTPPNAAEPGETWIRPMDGMNMIFIPAGEFEMGSSEAELDAAHEQCERDRGQGRCERFWVHDESPRHLVNVDAFWIDKTEVTNAQFATFLNKQGNQMKGDSTWLDLNDESSLIEQVDGEFRPKAGYDDHPAVEVTWYGALAYCQWVGGWLPSEAKWEYVARGPERSDYPWGNEIPTCEVANTSECQGSLMPVGSFPNGASFYGTEDMAGNVYEWVANWSQPYPGTQYDNIDFGTTFKVVRGGSWNFLPYYTRAAHRDYVLMPHISEDFVGFRCVIALE